MFYIFSNFFFQVHQLYRSAALSERRLLNIALIKTLFKSCFELFSKFFISTVFISRFSADRVIKRFHNITSIWSFVKLYFELFSKFFISLINLDWSMSSIITDDSLIYTRFLQNARPVLNFFDFFTQTASHAVYSFI